MTFPVFAAALARCFVSGEQCAEALNARTQHALGRDWRWARWLGRRYLATFPREAPPSHQRVVHFLAGHSVSQLAFQKYRGEISISLLQMEAERMRPTTAAASQWKLPAIESAGALADWLCLALDELDWLADRKRLAAKSTNTKLRHYWHRTLAKPSGGLRLIEAPKKRLKEVQQRILRDILDKITPHPAAHGFVRGRSIRSFAAPHVGQRVVLRIDLRNFFPTFPAARVQAMFRTIGYPDTVAALLTGLCTTAAPREICKLFEDRGERELYRRAHLPQGAPSSPALANVCSRRVDRRLTGLAEAAGAVYTRYADDLAFSGGEDFERCVDRFAARAAAILREEGFRVRQEKTRVMRQGMRQQVAGLVTNKRMNLPRVDFDNLKAILTNCVRSGAESQNRDGRENFHQHLEGRVAFAESINAARGAKLREILQRIEWRDA